MERERGEQQGVRCVGLRIAVRAVTVTWAFAGVAVLWATNPGPAGAVVPSLGSGLTIVAWILGAAVWAFVQFALLVHGPVLVRWIESSKRYPTALLALPSGPPVASPVEPDLVAA